MNIAIGSDHAGFELKKEIIDFLKDRNIHIIDKGAYSSERADYPDFGHAVATSILDEEAETGILLCGTGNGIAIAANRHKGVRAALCWNPDIAALARQHNNANIIVLPAKHITKEVALKCIDVFLREKFEGGRHQQRIEKIEC
jgi:ribose 5-phosphate isomerase B